MEINISKNNCQFILKPEERKTICILAIPPNLLERYIRELNTKMPIIWTTNIVKLLQISLQYTGIATCSEEDEWDDEVGKDVAYIKAKQAFAADFISHAYSFFNFFTSAIQTMKDNCDALNEEWNKNLAFNIISVEKKLSKSIFSEDTNKEI